MSRRILIDTVRNSFILFVYIGSCIQLMLKRQTLWFSTLVDSWMSNVPDKNLTNVKSEQFVVYIVRLIYQIIWHLTLIWFLYIWGKKIFRYRNCMSGHASVQVNHDFSNLESLKMLKSHENLCNWHKNLENILTSNQRGKQNILNK